MTKEQLRQEIAVLTSGEDPPSTWSKTELKCRLAVLREENGMTVSGRGQSKTPLQQAISKLNTASKNKSNLRKHLREAMGISVDDNETMLQMQKKGVAYLYENVMVVDGDVVGFGRHAALTYLEVVTEYPRYTAWVKQTAREEKECCPQLRRLATWIEQTENGKSVTTTKSVPALQEPPPEVSSSASQGTSRRIPPRPERHNSQPKSAEDTKVMSQLLETMKEIKEEVAELRGERPRKKEKDGNESSKDSLQTSFQMVKD